jgi:hypothetical protein
MDELFKNLQNHIQQSGHARLHKEELEMIIKEIERVKSLEEDNRWLKSFYNNLDPLYGTGLEFANSQQNGKRESFDQIFDNARYALEIESN